jgi:DNA-binding beta-propeller fold protein YncE
VDLSSNRYDCGACGRACGTNERCERGLCLADVYVACWDSNGPQVRGATLGLEVAGVPLPTDSGPVRFAAIGDALYVANSLSSTLTAIAFDPPGVRSTYQGSPYGLAIPIGVPAGTYPDVEFVAADRGLLYVSNAAVGKLVVVDPARNGTVVDEISLATSGLDWPNPQGIAFDHGPDHDRAYVALYGMNQIAVVDTFLEGSCPSAPPCGSIVARIDVQPLADAGGQAEPSRLAVAGGKLYVTLSNLTASWPPTAAGNGKLAVIDLATGALDPSPVDLGAACKNTADVTALGGVLYATCGMLDFSSSAIPKPVIGTAIVPVDVSGPTPTVGEPIAVPDPIAPGRLAFCGGAGYAGDRNTPAVLRLDPATRTVTTSTAICPASAAFASDVTCAP